MSRLDAYIAARAAFVDHDALLQEMLRNPVIVEGLGDWRGVRFANAPAPGGFPDPGPPRVIDAAEWTLGQESAAMLNAMLAAWHRMLAAMHTAWESLGESERGSTEAPPEDRVS